MCLSKLAVVIWEIEQLIGFILEISCEKICTVFMGSKSISKNKDLFGRGKLFVQDIGQTVFTINCFYLTAWTLSVMVIISQIP